MTITSHSRNKSQH